MVTAMRSRIRVAREGWNQKTKRGYPNPVVRDADQMGVSKAIRGPVPVMRPPANRQSFSESSVNGITSET
jgi:hypothetical protein